MRAHDVWYPTLPGTSKNGGDKSIHLIESRTIPMSKRTVKSVLVTSLSLLCASISASVFAADPPESWTTNFNIGNFTAFCKVKALPTRILGIGKYQIGCYKVGPGTKGLEVNFSSDQMFTRKWSALRGTTKSTRYDCSEKDKMPQGLEASNVCLKDPDVTSAYFDGYSGKEVTRINTYTRCRGQPGWPIHYRFWVQGTVTFTVKEPYSGQVKTITTSEIKGPGRSYLSEWGDCGWE